MTSTATEPKFYCRLHFVFLWTNTYQMITKHGKFGALLAWWLTCSHIRKFGDDDDRTSTHFFFFGNKWCWTLGADFGMMNQDARLAVSLVCVSTQRSKVENHQIRHRQFLAMSPIADRVPVPDLFMAKLQNLQSMGYDDMMRCYEDIDYWEGFHPILTSFKHETGVSHTELVLFFGVFAHQVHSMGYISTRISLWFAVICSREKRHEKSFGLSNWKIETS